MHVPERSVRSVHGTCLPVADVLTLQVRGSPVSAKRSFLEKKGLTADEIDEALKRVPEAPAAAAAATVPAGGTPTVGANNLVTYTQQPSHGSVAGQVHQAPSPAGALIPVQQHQQQQLMPPPQPEPLRWTQVGLELTFAERQLVPCYYSFLVVFLHLFATASSQGVAHALPYIAIQMHLCCCRSQQ